MLLDACLRSSGFPEAIGLPLDGQFHRFDRAGVNTGRFKGWVLPSGAQKAWWQDMKTDESGRWESGVEGLTPDQLAARAQEFAELRAREERERGEEQAQVALDCEAIWGDLIDRGVTPYLTRKGLHKLYGAKIDADDTGVLIVPARDIDGKLWSLQRILPQKPPKGPDKVFKSGGRKKGCFHLMGEISPKGTVYVCEGFATAASVYEASNQSTPTIAAFDAGNLIAVGTSLRAKYPDLRIVFCADDDRYGERGRNRGVEAATQAADRCRGKLRLPQFTDAIGEPTDFNDLHQRTSLAEVLRQLTEEPGAGRISEQAIARHDTNHDIDPVPNSPVGEGTCQDQNGASSSPPQENDNYSATPVQSPPLSERVVPASEFNPLGIGPLPIRTNQQGRPQAPSQQRIVDHCLDYFGGSLAKQGKDFFYYVGTHWQHLSDRHLDLLRVMVQKVCQGVADVKLIDATYKLLTYHLPGPPEDRDFFTPHPFCANFMNGTLHLFKAGQGYEMAFKPHRREDYLTNVLPYEYRAGDQERNSEFEAMLARVFAGDPDIEQKIRAVREMYGACLVPAFPRLFMCHGKPGTGKSTVIRIALRLVHKDNFCSVPPSQWHGFNMEGMAMKLVNADTDIPYTQPMDDDMAKKVIEREKFRIRRKGIKDIMAPIPAVHLFGGNALPKTLEGATGAHRRRWTFLGFNAFVPRGNYDQFYWDFCFEQSPQGVLNFALAGLADLCANGGHFTQPESGLADMLEWERANDPVGRFLADLVEGDIQDQNNQYIVDSEAKIERSILWEAFKKFHLDSFGKLPSAGRHSFYERVKMSGYRALKIDGVRYIKGVRVMARGSGQA